MCVCDGWCVCNVVYNGCMYVCDVHVCVICDVCVRCDVCVVHACVFVCVLCSARG